MLFLKAIIAAMKVACKSRQLFLLELHLAGETWAEKAIFSRRLQWKQLSQYRKSFSWCAKLLLNWRGPQNSLIVFWQKKNQHGYKVLRMISNISNTKRECFMTFPNTKKRVEHTMCSRVFSKNFKEIGNVIKHSLF